MDTGKMGKWMFYIATGLAVIVPILGTFLSIQLAEAALMYLVIFALGMPAGLMNIKKNEAVLFLSCMTAVVVITLAGTLAGLATTLGILGAVGMAILSGVNYMLIGAGLVVAIRYGAGSLKN